MQGQVRSSGVYSCDGAGLDRLETCACKYGSAGFAKLASMAALWKPQVDAGCMLVGHGK